MTPYARFNLQFLLIALSLVTLVAAANYAVDPYGVFQTRLLKYPYVFAMNERFAKIVFLEHHQPRFTSFVFGSSRAAVINPSTLERSMPEDRFYNLSVTLGPQTDHLQHLKYLLSQRYPLHTLLVSIDLDCLTVKIVDTEYSQTLHPDVSGRSLLLTYLKYLTILPYKNLKNKITMNWSGDRAAADRLHWDLETGRLIFAQQDAQIAANPEGYVKQEATFHETVTRARYASPKDNLDALKDIKRLCLAHRLSCLFFVSPLHHKMMDSLNLQLYWEALEAIGRTTDFYDFSGYNTITVDDHNFYEMSHYRPFVGDVIAARIFHDAAVDVPRDFGVHVTPGTLDAHLQDLRRQIAKRRSDGTVQ